MDYQIIELEEFNVIGIRYELSKSLSNNVKLAQNHWKIFNSKLDKVIVAIFNPSGSVKSLLSIVAI